MNTKAGPFDQETFMEELRALQEAVAKPETAPSAIPPIQQQPSQVQPVKPQAAPAQVALPQQPVQPQAAPRQVAQPQQPTIPQVGQQQPHRPQSVQGPPPQQLSITPRLDNSQQADVLPSSNPQTTGSTAVGGSNTEAAWTVVVKRHRTRPSQPPAPTQTRPSAPLSEGPPPHLNYNERIIWYNNHDLPLPDNYSTPKFPGKMPWLKFQGPHPNDCPWLPEKKEGTTTLRDRRKRIRRWSPAMSIDKFDLRMNHDEDLQPCQHVYISKGACPTPTGQKCPANHNITRAQFLWLHKERNVKIRTINTMIQFSKLNPPADMAQVNRTMTLLPQGVPEGPSQPPVQAAVQPDTTAAAPSIQPATPLLPVTQPQPQPGVVADTTPSTAAAAPAKASMIELLRQKLQAQGLVDRGA
jgi:hypothetical protein